MNSTSNGDLTRRFIVSLFAELLDFAGVFSGVLQLGLPDGQTHVAIIINLSARFKINPMSQNLVSQIGDLLIIGFQTTSIKTRGILDFGAKMISNFYKTGCLRGIFLTNF